MSPRRLITRLHRWIGLTAGLVLVTTGLSGSLLVFREAIDRRLNPTLLVVTPGAGRASLEGVLAEVARRYPGEPPARVRAPRQADGVYEIWLGQEVERYVYADPHTGRVLGARRPTEFLTGWLFYWHSRLLSGEMGKGAMGVLAILLFALSVSGLVLWWPRGRWWLALTVKRGAGAKRANYDVHRALGFYASGFLLLASFTGASLVFHEPFERAINGATRSAPRPRAPRATSSPALPALGVDSLLALAERAQPGGAVSFVYLPTAPEAPFGVRKRLPGELHPNGKSLTYLDPRTGAVLLLENGATAPVGGRIYSALYPLHTGRAGGLPTRVLALVGGLMPAILFGTGAAMWWGRRRGQRRRQGARQPVVPRVTARGRRRPAVAPR